MSKKKFIILTTVLLSVLALIILLFGAVFCLRKQNVVIVDGASIPYSSQEIIDTAKLKNGKSIFALDKQSAIDRIETTYPEIKVVQIKTTSVIAIEIRIRLRIAMYYSIQNDNYYILDEELKILEVTKEDSSIQNLIKINNDLEINSTAKVGEFIGTTDFSSLTDNLFTAMFTQVDTVEGENADRDDIKEIIDSIELTDVGYDVLTINTRVGVVIKIGKPNDNINYKINVCFVIYNKLALGEIANGDNTHGTIKYLFNSEGLEIIGYQA